MKKTTTTFLASNKLNEVKNQLEDTDVKNQLVSVLEKINLRGTFEINQDVNDLADYHSAEMLEIKEKLAKKHWYSLVDFLREKIYLYESHSDKEWVSREISKKLNGCNPEEFWVYSSAGLDRIDRRLDFLTDHTTISFDVKRLQFVFAGTKEVHGIYYQIDLESGELNTHLLPLFNFSFLNNLQSMAARLDDKLVLLFMKNACGLLSNESLATELIPEIKSNLIQVVEDWAINFNDGELHLDRFPIDFYDSDFLNQKLSTENYFEFSKLLDSKQDKENTRSNPKKKIRKMFYFGKFKKYYKDFLVQLIEGKVDFNKYPYSTIQDKEIYHCSEEEISELKKELIPLLEKIEAEGKIFVNPYYYFHHYTPEKGAGGKNFVKYCCNQNGILMKLFDLLDWYPNKFGVYELVFSNGLLVKDLELYSYIKYASKVEGFDYKIFIELRNNLDCNWPIRRKVQLNNIAKKILGNGTIFDPDDKNISDEQRVSSDYNLYNKSIEPKFIFKKIRSEVIRVFIFSLFSVIIKVKKIPGRECSFMVKKQKRL